MAGFARKGSSQVSQCDELDENSESVSILDGTTNGGGAYGSWPIIVIDPPSSTSPGLDTSCDVGVLEDTSFGGVKKKKRDKVRHSKKMSSKVDIESFAIKGGGASIGSDSAVAAELEEGCVLNLACNMERVNSTDDFYTYDRSCSPYISSEYDREASDHSDPDADHSDSSDDDNPTSQVDRMIERGARLIMDGETSNVSSESDDTDNDFCSDSDSDITDVSPLVSNTVSPLGLSPVVSRRNLMSSFNQKPPFMRHYSHRGHEGDVEDEGDEDKVYQDDFFGIPEDDHQRYSANAPKMSFVVQALLKLSMQEGEDKQMNHDPLRGTEEVVSPSKYRHSLCPSLNANPHHRHLNKRNSKRKNMSFTNEEVRVINRDNSILLEKILAVDNREDLSAFNRSIPIPRPSNSSVNRRRQEENIKKDNLALLRRLSETKSSRNIPIASSKTQYSSHHNSNSSAHYHHHYHHRHHHKPHHHHNQHHNTVRSCSITARQSHHGTPFSPAHHSPKETAL